MISQYSPIPNIPQRRVSQLCAILLRPLIDEGRRHALLRGTLQPRLLLDGVDVAHLGGGAGSFGATIQNGLNMGEHVGKPCLNMFSFLFKVNGKNCEYQLGLSEVAEPPKSLQSF